MFERLLPFAIAAAACSTPNGTPQPYVAKDGVVAATPPVAVPDTIVVAVTGLRSDEGTVRCFLYDSAEDFPDSSVHVIARAVALPASHGATCKFTGVQRDRDYAIVTLHDENNDNVFQKGPFGIPKEGYAFSNNATASLSAPSYEACRFHMTQGTFTMPITMNY